MPPVKSLIQTNCFLIAIYLYRNIPVPAEIWTFLVLDVYNVSRHWIASNGGIQWLNFICLHIFYSWSVVLLLTHYFNLSVIISVITWVDQNTCLVFIIYLILSYATVNCTHSLLQNSRRLAKEVAPYSRPWLCCIML